MLNKEQNIEYERLKEQFNRQKRQNVAEMGMLKGKIGALQREMARNMSVERRIQLIKQQCQLLRKYKDIEFNDKHTKFTPPRFPIRLYTVNKYVYTYNDMMLRKQGMQIYKVVAMDKGETKYLEVIERPEREIRICENAQVMICRNIDIHSKLVNGTVGIIKKILYENQFETDGDVVVLNALENKVVVQLVVTDPETNAKEEVSIVAAKIESSSAQGTSTATRYQLPLVLAYAISIHKAQGITLDQAAISLDRCFSPGQAYVALSRLRNLDGLRLIGFSPENIQVDQSCLEFHRKIMNIDLQNPHLFDDGRFLRFGRNLIEKCPLVSGLDRILAQNNIECSEEEMAVPPSCAAHSDCESSRPRSGRPAASNPAPRSVEPGLQSGA